MVPGTKAQVVRHPCDQDSVELGWGQGHTRLAGRKLQGIQAPEDLPKTPQATREEGRLPWAEPAPPGGCRCGQPWAGLLCNGSGME